MTPAQKAGFVVGQQYVITGGYKDDHGFPIGTTVTFTSDDGSDCPRFEGPNDGGDGYEYPRLCHVGKLPGSSNVLFEYKEIVKEVTIVHAGRVLTPEEKVAIQKIIDEG